MFKGFYGLTSGMLSQGRNLDIVANNLTNLSTSGYKSDRYVGSTFEEVMLSRIGNKDKENPAELGTETSYILAPSESVTNYKQGTLEETGLLFDFAIEGEGFFAVQTEDGRAYTRNGSFALDNEGYLCLPERGRVLDTAGQPILLGTDQIAADSAGNIIGPAGQTLGTLGVFSFADNAQLEKTGAGMFTSAQQPQASNAIVHHEMIERANTDMLQQMTEMITSQRALQSAAQMSKLYYQIMTKAANDVGRM